MYARGDLWYKKTSYGDQVYFKFRGGLDGEPPESIWYESKFSASEHGTQLLDKILCVREAFQYPKSPHAVAECIQVASTNKNAVVVDFFAGSGTTAQAVLQLNKDGGNRQFIICTNNENNICSDICYPRVKKVMNGYKDSKGQKISGLGGNLKYYKTDFVDADPTDKNKKKLTEMATEMLCLKEGTFQKVTNKKAFKIYKNTKHYTGIIFDQMAIPDFKEAIAKLKGRFSVYVFSLGDDSFEDEFDDVKQRVKLSPIPEVILRVYRRIFK